MSDSEDKDPNNQPDNQPENAAQVVARIVRCPSCKKSSPYSPSNKFRPFCSQRCQQIDLGDWADGRYTVPAEPHEMTPEEQELLEAEIARRLGVSDDSDQG